YDINKLMFYSDYGVYDPLLTSGIYFAFYDNSDQLVKEIRMTKEIAQTIDFKDVDVKGARFVKLYNTGPQLFRVSVANIRGVKSGVTVIPQYDLKEDVLEAEKVKFSWKAQNGAEKYYIYRDDVRIAETKNTSYEDLNLQPDNDYKYQVSYVEKGTEYPKSGALKLHTPVKKDTTPPSVVQSVYVSNHFESFTVNWKPNTEPDLDGYNVYVDGKKVNSSLIKSTSYTVRGLTNGTQYKVEISAVDKSGNESLLSLPVYAVPDSKSIPPVKFMYSLKDIVDGIAHWFSGIWLILAFSVAIPLSFYVGNRVKGLFA
ncbi:fibronectin type III domain-containing protein, partial [Paenibacillus sp. NAIST15-1]|uniref:fibronectin type III domain-containing protein n=1 Tax=Paenibacillus sp. NAIST15-1 TaxID=1605994 RepID=UPI000B2C1E72